LQAEIQPFIVVIVLSSLECWFCTGNGVLRPLLSPD